MDIAGSIEKQRSRVQTHRMKQEKMGFILNKPSKVEIGNYFYLSAVRETDEQRFQALYSDRAFLLSGKAEDKRGSLAKMGNAVFSLKN